MEGWGGSLSWWANMLGTFSDARIKLICDWITDPVNGLNMNLFRFNIGGGDNPTHHHMRTDGGAMPGYKSSATAAYNWKQDSCQRKVLKQLIASRIAKAGVNDLKLVAYSNSPPWWMTTSECTSGNTSGTTCNLRYDQYEAFADYLTDVVKYYHDDLGITFRSIEPFNEPFSNWWIANTKNGQEGCYYSNANQQTLIRQINSKLIIKGMNSWCNIVAMDANSIDEGLTGLTNYKNAGDILPMIGRLDVHSYAGTKRQELASLAASCSLPIWQTESGPYGISGSTDQQILNIAQRIITDLREMKCTAWLDGQLATKDLTPQWGMIQSDFTSVSSAFSKSPAFYIRSQYSKYLKKDYTLLSNSSDAAVSALSPDGKQVVVVICNTDTATNNFYVDLSEFYYWDRSTMIQTQLPVTLYCLNRTSILCSSENGFYVEALPSSVTTLLIPVNQTTAIQQEKEANMECFNREVMLTFPGVESCDLSVYNSFGQCVEHDAHANANGKTTLNVQDGFYVVRCKAGQRFVTQKILITR
jgi:O-glycosyl hydrolase